MLLGSDVHTAASAPDLAALLDQCRGETLDVLGPGVDLGDALAIAAEYRVNRPSLGVVLVRDRLDVGLLGEARRRSGVTPSGWAISSTRRRSARCSPRTRPASTRCSRRPARPRPSG